MFSIGNEALKLVKVKSMEQVENLLHGLESGQTHNSDFYSLNALREINRKRLQEAWLWCWRGLYDFPESEKLLSLMGLVNKSLNRGTSINHEGQKEAGVTQKDNDLLANSSSNHTKLKVLQGTMEIANQMNTIGKGIKRLGHQNDTLNYYPYYLGYTSDYTWPISRETNTSELNEKLKKLAFDLLPYYDLFHFHFGRTLTLDNSDLDLIKQHNKQIIMHHWGSDVRLLSSALKTNPYAKAKITNEKWLADKLAYLSGKIPYCIVADEEMRQYVEKFYEKVFIVPLMIDLQIYRPLEIKSDKTQQKLKIVHAPTSPAVKGTPFILEAMEKLKQEYTFEFKLIQGLSHEQAKQEYQSADLIIDQLHIGSYGLLAVEAMAMGKPVICWISEFMKEKYPKNLPIISANPDTIEAVMKHVFNNQDQLMEIGERGRRYVELHHNMVQNSKELLKIYQWMAGHNI
ncbi:glycosyltransferase [Sediminibacillus albus]|uniref:Glycosyltransferase involved in cell wall bisynthesis n=1 Tax=Sediminibacillus albus TaxID=407036 RepID=A0A1G9CD05_9BACI|nr:glycosyltransferase [Sediminibacillus albus]SDK49456.1 Glycosyltransferase involved in cell wall bisynthesis [Sediminibacillus albus]